MSHNSRLSRAARVLVCVSLAWTSNAEAHLPHTANDRPNSTLATSLRVSDNREVHSSVIPQGLRFHFDDQTTTANPVFAWRLDGPLFTAGLASVVIAASMRAEKTSVPSAGLSPSTVGFGPDRQSIGEIHTAADAASNRVRDLALSFPVLLKLVSVRNQNLSTAPLGTALMHVESMLIAQGLTGIIKRGVSRPRPFAYVPESDRPESGRYNANAGRAFESFPSGHATASWCAISTGVCDHVLSRPTASWHEHAVVGFSGGLLATVASALRIEAGQHFPTDVIAGSAIGVVSGTVPLLHRYVFTDGRMSLPPRESWLGAIGGATVGIGVGLLVGEAISD